MRQVEYDRYGGPEVLRFVNRPMPKPAPGEVRVEMRAAGVNPIDAKICAGQMAPAPGRFPATPGRDGAGIVTELGLGVPAAWRGVRVAFLAERETGTWAEAVTIPVAQLSPLPAAVTDVQAAAVPLAGLSAWRLTVEAATIASGMQVLVMGAAGGVGHLAVQIARNRGAKVHGVASTANADFVAALGAQHIPRDETPPARFFDLAIDLIGGDAHLTCCQSLAKGGRLMALRARPFQNRTAEFGLSFGLPEIGPDAAALTSILSMIAQGRLKVETETLPFESCGDGLARIATGHQRGKLVLTF